MAMPPASSEHEGEPRSFRSGTAGSGTGWVMRGDLSLDGRVVKVPSMARRRYEVVVSILRSSTPVSRA